MVTMFGRPKVTVQDELDALVRAGLTPYQALVTGTRNAAAYFGTLSESGTVAVGKRADLVLLDGNPLIEISNTARIAGVVSRGRWFARADLDRRIETDMPSMTRETAASVRVPDSSTDTAMPGMIPPSDLVTVVPFQLAPRYVLIAAELDGHRGLFLLDTGTPHVWLNSMYLKPGQRGNGEYPDIDPVAQGDTDVGGSSDGANPFLAIFPKKISRITLHTLRIGTLLYQFDTTGAGRPVRPLHPFSATLARDIRFKLFGQPVLGMLGLEFMSSFETIIDYPHQRLTLIRLDSAGRRLAAVPAYTPAATVPLVAYDDDHWGVRARMGDTTVTLLVDTGTPADNLPGVLYQRVASHVTPASAAMKKEQAQFDSVVTFRQGEMNNPITDAEVSSVDLAELDHLSVGDQVFDALPISHGSEPILGYPFFWQRRVVGFNLRTRKMIFYR